MLLLKFLAFVLFMTALFIDAPHRFKGWLGERRVKAVLKASGMRALHDVYLPRPNIGGLTQVDHVVDVGTALVCVETKNLRGKIRGTYSDKEWRRVYPSGFELRIKSPIKQNFWHQRALQDALPGVPVGGLVCLTGPAEFEGELPAHVCRLGTLVDDLKAIRSGYRGSTEAAWNQIRDTQRPKRRLRRMFSDQLSVTEANVAAAIVWFVGVVIWWYACWDDFVTFFHALVRVARYLSS